MTGSKIQLTFTAFLLAFLMGSSCYAQSSDEDKHIEVSLRMIGHKLLLNSEDSISRVLPIEKLDDDHYQIKFETEFEFNPDQLVNTVNGVMAASEITQGYIVEVLKCETDEVVYSYEMSDLDSMDMIPCQTRVQPKSCYRLMFTLISEKEIDFNPAKKYNPRKKVSSWSWILYGILGAVIGVVLFVIVKKNKPKRVDPNLISMGRFNFDTRKSELVIEKMTIELTSKESDLLLLLFKSANETVEREVILNQVWGDEGDYVGRTLDVFISKLRKKLEADPNVKIMNIRGVGYKLVVD